MPVQVKNPGVPCPCPEQDCKYFAPSYEALMAHYSLHHSQVKPRPSREDTERPDLARDIPPKGGKKVAKQKPDRGKTKPATVNPSEVEDPQTDTTNLDNEIPEQVTIADDEIPNVSYETMPEDPIKRLALILKIHGVDKTKRFEILSICRLHPGYTSNPITLHSVLTAKLSRNHHSSIPMMLNEFSSGEPVDPMNVPFMPPLGMQPYNPMMPGAGMQPYNPMMPGVGMQPYNPYAYSPPYYPQANPPKAAPSGKQDADDEFGSVMKIIGAITAFMKVMNPTGPQSSDQAIRDLQKTIQEMTLAGRDERRDLMDKFNEQMRDLQESSRQQVEQLKDKLHENERVNLLKQVQSLQQARAEEMSEGLGQIVSDVGTGAAAELQGVREEMSKGLDKVVGLVGQALRMPGEAVESVLPGVAPKAAPKRSVAEAVEIMELEDDIELLAQAISVNEAAAIPVEEALEELG